jgi:uncharacterized protein (TIGR00730 family)
MIVAVFGAAFLPEGGAAWQEAFRLGGRIAREGWALACGAYGGAMAAACRGAAEAGGRTIGVTCETLERAGRRKNDWVGEEIRCATVRERLCRLVEIADAVVALDGGIGTLAEAAVCWNQVQTGDLPPRPVVLLGRVWHETFRAFIRAAGEYLQEEDRNLLQFAASVDDAVRILRT